MAYVKQEWKGYPDTSTPITADRLNHIEDGIYSSGVPDGGTTGQVLAKKSDTNNDVEWVDQTGGSADYDSLPVGSVINFDGDTVPTGYEEVTDPNNYSLEEQVIGKWIDRKPIYRKSFFISGFPTFTSDKYTFNHNIANFGLCIKIYGVLYDTGNKYYFNLPYTGRGSADIMLYASSSKITVEQGPYGNNRLKDFYITIEYTKTTD